MEIWCIEDFKLMFLFMEFYGKFYFGDFYIVFRVKFFFFFICSFFVEDGFFISNVYY